MKRNLLSIIVLVFYTFNAIYAQDALPETHVPIDPTVSLSYSINTTWDCRPIDHDPIRITIGPRDTQNRLTITATGPYFGDPSAPNGTAGQPFPMLWEYEVAEAFFLNDNNQYLEVELSPHGQHLLLLLKAERDSFKQQLPMQYSATITGNTWKGVAYIKDTYFPPNVSKFNAYAIHGSGDKRVYESLYPVPTGAFPAADFHKLNYFRPIDFQNVLPSNWNTTYTSPEWNAIVG